MTGARASTAFPRSEHVRRQIYFGTSMIFQWYFIVARAGLACYFMLNAVRI